jgi:hypothetical protein
MLDEINRPFFLLALIAWLLVVCVEIGSSFLSVPEPTAQQMQAQMIREQPDEPPPSIAEINEMKKERDKDPPRPGYAITCLIFFDGLAFLGFFWMGAGLVLSRRFVGRIQGIISLIVSLITIIVGIITAILIFVLLTVMIGLFLAVPFGTLAYLAIWGFFNTSGAATTIGILLFLKIATGVLLVLAQRRFLLNKGLVVLLLLSIGLTFLISFLHGFPPGILVSITDAIAALIIMIVSIIWAILVFIGAIIATIKAIPPEKG